MAEHARLQRLLGGAALMELRQRLRARYQRGLEGGVVTLGKLNEVERAALCGMLGRRSGQGATLRVDLADLDAALLHGGLADSLRDALQILDGPITNLRAQRDSLQQQWEQVRAGCGEPRLAALLADAKGLGLLKRVAAGDTTLAARLCSDARRVLERLPAPAQARSHLAADILGDAHGLDAGRPVASLVLAALRKRNPDETAEGENQDDVEETARETWASCGVMVNELARPVLFLNLAALAPDCAQIGAGGEPGYLSLRSLLRAPPGWNARGRMVYVCENPNLVAIAADALGARCAPLVCTDGMPAAAQRTLLAQLQAAGAVLCYHGDYDWPGITIGNAVMRQFGAQPWRFGAADYLAAVADVAGAARPLGVALVAAQWDPGLCAAMAAQGRAIDEEVLAQVLLDDLGADDALT